MVEQILAQNDLNIGLHRGWKVPKLTKFFGETNESAVEHFAIYQTKTEDIANSENLKMKYFPNSLTVFLRGSQYSLLIPYTLGVN